MQQIQEYLQTKIAPAEWIGDFRLEDGDYFFTVSIIHGDNINYENSIFDVIGVELSGSRVYIKLKIEQNACEFFTASWVADGLKKVAEGISTKINLSLEDAIRKGLGFKGQFFKDNRAFTDFVKQNCTMVCFEHKGEYTNDYLVKGERFMSHRLPNYNSLDIKCNDNACTITHDSGVITYY